MSAQKNLSQADVVEAMRAERIVMLTTSTAEGKLVSHPMTVQEVTEDGDAWLFIDLGSDQADALRAGPTVNLAFTGSGSWLSVSGTAELVDDRARIDRLWDGSVDAYFDGAEDPRLGLLHVGGDSARFWGVPGGAPAVLATIVKSKVTGGKPAGESGTTEL